MTLPKLLKPKRKAKVALPFCELLDMPEPDADIIVYRLRHQVKQMRKFRPTVPFHSERKCEDRLLCAFHRRRK